MSTLSDISIDRLPYEILALMLVWNKQASRKNASIYVSVYSLYVRHSNAILYVWHTCMCVCTLMSIAEREVHAYGMWLGGRR